MDALAPLYFVKIWGLHVRRIGICVYGYIHGYPRKSVNMNIDMDGKFHIHGKPGNSSNYWPQIYVATRGEHHNMVGLLQSGSKFCTRELSRVVNAV